MEGQGTIRRQITCGKTNKLYCNYFCFLVFLLLSYMPHMLCGVTEEVRGQLESPSVLLPCEFQA